LHDDQVDACSGAFAELGLVAMAMPEVPTVAAKLRVEPLAYDSRWWLIRSWYLSGSMFCCVWFQVEDGSEHVSVLLEMHSETEWASSFVGRVLEATRKLYLAAQHPHDIVIVPSFSHDTDTQENINALYRQGVHARQACWEPERANAVFGEWLESDRISVHQGCPTIVQAIRSGYGRKRGASGAVDSYMEPLTRAVIGGIAAAFTLPPSGDNTRNVYVPRPWSPKAPWRR